NSMRKSRYTNSQILAILKQAQAGTPVPELCREHGMSSATFYKWRAKYGGMDSSMIARLKELEAENTRLKKMYAEERIKAEILKEAIEKSGSAISPQADGAKSSLALSNQHTTCIMESQACLPHLPRTGAQFTYQASSSSHAKAPEPLVMGIQQQTA